MPKRFGNTCGTPASLNIGLANEREALTSKKLLACVLCSGQLSLISSAGREISSSLPVGIGYVVGSTCLLTASPIQMPWTAALFAAVRHIIRSCGNYPLSLPRLQSAAAGHESCTQVPLPPVADLRSLIRSE